MKSFLVITLFAFWGSCVVQNTIAQTTPEENADKTLQKSEVKYQSYWNQIDEYRQKSLPKSALNESRKAFSIARNEANGPMMLKALIFNIEFVQAISPDSLESALNDAEAILSESKDPLFKAMLHLVLADAYANQYTALRWKIDQRTSVSGDASDNMQEWTSDRFAVVIRNHVKQALQNQSLLVQTPANTYSAVLDKGKDSPRFRKTLFDLVAFQSIELLQNVFLEENQSLILSLYNDLESVNSKLGNREARVLAELSRLDYVFVQDGDAVAFERSLINLQNRYATSPISVEVTIRLVQYYLMADKASENEKALSVCQYALSHFPQYERIGLVKQLINQILMPDLQANLPAQFYPQTKTNISFRCKNVKRIYLRVYRVNAPLSGDLASFDKNYSREKVLEEQYQIIQRISHESVDTLVKISIPQIGNYLAEIEGVSDEAKGDTVRIPFSVSRIGAVSRSVQGQVELLVADFKTGKPISNAQVLLYQSDYRRNFKEVARFVGGNDGIYTLVKPEQANHYKVVLGADVYSPISSLPYASRPAVPQTGADFEQLYCDRAIYRPGQTVGFKGICYRSSLDRGQEALENMPVTVKLLDVNGTEVARRELKTNEFGSYAGEFVLPRGGLTGNYSISSSKATVSFVVSEYKMPKFRIDMAGDTRTYRFGDQISVSGKAESFSGVKIANAEVNYKVVRSRHWLCWWNNSPETIVASGQVKTDAKGAFVVSFIPEKEKTQSVGRWLAYSYSVEASITDATGETQRANMAVPVGDVSMVLQPSLPDVVDREHLPVVMVKAQNLNGASVSAHGTYKLYRYTNQSLEDLDDGKSPVRETKVAFSGTFEANRPIDITNWSYLVSGKYVMIVESKDDQGRIMTAEKEFTLFHFYEKRPPMTTYLWKYESVTECRVGEPAVILFGSSADIDVLFEIYDNKSLVDRKRLPINNNVRRVVVPYLSEYGKSITIHFSFFKNGKFFHEVVSVNQIDKDNHVSMQWNSFRKKQIPGQKEEWKLIVRDKEDHPIKAELMAGMYDTALDRIVDYQPQFSLPTFNTVALSPWFSNGRGYQSQAGWQSFNGKNYTFEDFSFDRIKFPEYKLGGGPVMIRGLRSASFLGRKKIDEELPVLNESVGVENEKVAEMLPLSPKVASGPAFPLRQNFGETAFFYPQLLAGRDGIATISFTLPESLTQWKFYAFAHTKDMRCTQLIDTVVARKEIMIESFLPRFVRQGDRLVVSAKVSNLTEKLINGKVKAEFFNPITDQLMNDVVVQPQSFEVESGSSVSVSWSLNVPVGAELLGCRFVAESDRFSDGEEQILPVLTQKQLITESFPVNFSKPGEKTITLSPSNETQSEYRTSVEMVSNPAWYAVQALPVVSVPKSEDLISWFSSYYVNSLATKIAKSSPSVVSYLRSVSLSPEAQKDQLSKLEKNQDLKSVLVEETPWLIDAKEETQQIQGLSQLLDVNRSRQLSSEALVRLAQYQQPSGGFGWYKQMPANDCLTRFVLKNMYRLQEMGAEEKTDESLRDNIIKNAIRYLDEMLVNSYKNLKKNNANWQTVETTSFYDLQTLLIRAHYQSIPMSNGVVEAYRFMETVAERQWTKLSLNEKALTVQLFMHKNLRTEAMKVLQSIKEFGIESADMGLSFPSTLADNRFGCSPLSVHTSIMEAFDEVGGEDASLEKMKIWLIKNKQTNRWGTVPETVDAVYALLKRGGDLLSTICRMEVKIGDKTLLTTNPESPKFEYKADITSSDLNKGDRKIIFRKSSSGMAWGAVYHQYFEDMSLIKGSQGALSITKTLFVEQVLGKQKKLIPFSESMQMKVGDKLVTRLVVKADRDLSFVHLKDTRAACLEPVAQLSGMSWQESLPLYLETKDASTQYFIQDLPKGTYVFEYPTWITRTGVYTSGSAIAQCLYAPEFVGNTKGMKLIVK